MSTQYRWDDFVLDLEDFRLERAGARLALEPKALNLLTFLVQRPGRLVTKQEIFDAVWTDTAVTDHALTRVIAQLRRVLGDEAREAKYIETVPTRGYRWIRPITPLPLGADTPAVAAPSAPSRSTLAVAALLTLTVALALTLWAQRTSTTSANVTSGDPSSRHRVMWPVQVTTRTGLDLQPAISPTGDAIAYVSDRTGAFEIYVRAIDGTALDTPLTSDGAQNVQPAWSPDGRYVAYHSYRHGGVWVVPARGGVPRQIAVQGSNPAWAPDGQRIAFQSDEHVDVTPSGWLAQTGSTLWLVDADGANLKALTTTGRPMGGHASPSWSHDSRFIAFTVFEGAIENGVWLLNIASGEVSQLASGPGLFELVFAPDDRAIYVAGGEAFVLRLGFDPKTATTTGDREVIPIAGVPAVRGLSIAADGKTMAFSGLALSSQIWAQRVKPDGTREGDAHAVTSDTSRRNSLATTSPDGRKIAYMSTRGGAAPDVWVMNADGSNAMSLTSDEASDGKPTWFPDGTRIAYMSNRNRTLGLWAVDITTRRHEPILDYASVRSSAKAQQIGSLAELHVASSISRIAFSVIAPPTGRRRIYVATLSPYEARPLTDGSESIGYPAWSPDEKHLAVEIKEGSSMHAGIVDAATGVVRRLTNERGQRWVRSWSPDSRRVAMAALRDGAWSLRWIDITSGREEILVPPLPPHIYVRYPEWSPRGDVVLFERGELRGNIWTLSLN